MVEVVLRETLDEDLPILFGYQADPVASRMAAFPSRDAEAFMAHWAKIRADDAVITKTIVVNGQVVGGIASFEVDRERDVGYWIGREHWGRSIATTALAAFLQVDPTRPLHARVAVHNLGSRRVLEKCAFTLVDRRPPTPDDDIEELTFRLDA